MGLARQIGVSKEMVGRYERNEAIPSLDIAKRLSKSLGVSLDYLVGNIKEEIDRVTLQRLRNINNLSEENKKLVYTFLDAFITKTKLEDVLE